MDRMAPIHAPTTAESVMSEAIDDPLLVADGVVIVVDEDQSETSRKHLSIFIKTTRDSLFAKAYR